MANLEDIANDPDWQPVASKPIATSLRNVSTYFGREEDLTVLVRMLKNGLLYAIAVDENGMPVLRQGSYPVVGFPRGDSNYQLIDIRGMQKENIKVFSATFEYEAGRTPDGQSQARIEYTIWHSPISGLTVLRSLHANQAVEDGWLDVQLNSATNDIERSMTAKVFSQNESLSFDRDGNLQIYRPGLFHASRELADIYGALGNGANVDELRRIDALKTAKALVEGFPSQRPLQIEQLIRYNPEYLRPRMF